jgi:hypothetical protein
VELCLLLGKLEDWDTSAHVQVRGTELGTLDADGSSEAIKGEVADEVIPAVGGGTTFVPTSDGVFLSGTCTATMVSSLVVLYFIVSGQGQYWCRGISE